VLVHMRETLLVLRDDLVTAVSILVHRDHLLETDAEGHDLEATRVSERRSVPVHELAEAAGLVDDVTSRLQEQVISVRKHSLAAQLPHRRGKERLYGGFRPDRNKRWRLDLPVR